MAKNLHREIGERVGEEIEEKKTDPLTGRLVIDIIKVVLCILLILPEELLL